MSVPSKLPSVTIFVTPSTADLLEKLAAKHETSVGAICRAAIAHGLAHPLMGRTSLPTGRTRKIKFHLPDALKSELRTICFHEGVSLSKWLAVAASAWAEELVREDAGLPPSKRMLATSKFARENVGAHFEALKAAAARASA